MNRILITGGTGALGSALANYLQNVIGCDVLCGSRNTPNSPTRISFRMNDAAEMKVVLTSFQPTVVIHLAGTLSSEFEEAFETNVENARRLLETLVQIKHFPRIVLAGSAAEYGVVRPEENPLREDRILRPVSVYGMTKAWQSSLGYFFAHRGCDVLIARIFNLWGPGLSDQLFAGRVANQISRIQTGQQDRLSVGSLSAIRDYVSLDEAARQIWNIAMLGQSGEIYHVASGEPILMRELLARSLAEVGLSMQIVDETRLNSPRKDYDVPAIYADVSKTAALSARR